MGNSTISSKFDALVLCGDIGGTNANFGILGIKNNLPEIIFKSSEITTSVSDFLELVEEGKENKYNQKYKYTLINLKILW